jgi:MFS family permease
MVGSFLTPMAAGIQAKYTGWRSSYIALSISLTLVFVIFCFGFEETKYVPVLQGVSEAQPSGGDVKGFEYEKDKAEEHLNISLHQTNSNARGTDSAIPPATYRQRMRWVTYSSESLWKIAYFPAYTVLLPHVAYSALQYAAGISWLVIIASIIPIRFTQPPYNFGTDGIGLMSLGPFVGNLIGSFYSGVLGDRSVRWLAKRNGGYYEPEMRLYLLLPPALLMSGGIIMFGTTADRVSYKSFLFLHTTPAGHPSMISDTDQVCLNS